jgi:hypothetical protein
MTRSTALESKEKLILLAAFQATYQNSITSLTPDMVPIVIDTGASISISPYASDFAGHIRPVQRVTLKGIASGLPVAGIGDIQYQFTNDEGEDQTITLRDCLHVPNCSIRLLCPRQIGVTTGNQRDGFNATNSSATLTVNDKPTTIPYDSTSQLPVLFTNPGITSFQ